MTALKKYTLTTFAISIIFFLWVPALSAQQNANNELAEAQQWLAESKYHKAFQSFQFYAQEKQNHLAQFTLALFYQEGWGVERDEVVACQWHGKAAEGGIPAANHFFAQCLQDGIHQSADYVAAIHWYQQAANLGHTISLCAIADLHMRGNGVEKNPQKALAFCQQAASVGSIPAQLKMGQFYLNGEAAIRDPQQAVIWFGFAAEKNSLEAYYYLGVTNLTALNDQSQALYWFEMAASQGYLPAYYQTARLYFNAPLSEETGMPTADNLAKSYLWLSAAKQQSEQESELKDTLSMLEKVEQVMPESWKEDLDQKISQHLLEFH
jgi:uncharacterized protein